MAHAPTACDQCGQVDDHPKLHYGPETYHHDCVPHRVLRDLTTYGYNDAGGTWVEGPDIPAGDLPEPIKQALSYRDKASGGVRGDKLRAYIQKQEG